MSFITDKKQLKQANSSLTINLTIESLRSFLNDAEDRFRKQLGFKAFKELEEKPDTDAHRRMRSAIVNLALGLYADSGQLLISDAGMHVSKSQSLLPASDKKIVSFKRGVFEKSDIDFDTMLMFLESDIDSFPIWKDSEERKEWLSSFFRNSYEFANLTIVDVSVGVFLLLHPEIKRIQRDCILPVLGEALMDEMLLKSYSGEVLPHERKLIKQIRYAIAPLSLAGFIPYQMIYLSTDGVFQRSHASQSDNIEVENSPNTRVLQKVMNSLITTGEGELETLRIWLNENIHHFPTARKQAIAPMADINQGLEGTGVYLM